MSNLEDSANLLSRELDQERNQFNTRIEQMQETLLVTAGQDKELAQQALREDLVEQHRLELEAMRVRIGKEFEVDLAASVIERTRMLEQR